jgi:hypothetical protein
MAVFFLPFTWELVADVGFPLKVYEVLFILALAVGLFYRQNYRDLMLTKPALVLSLFIGVVLITGMAGFRLIDLAAAPAWAVGRCHPYYSTLSEILYLFFDAAVMLMVWDLALDSRRRRMIFWLLTISSVVAVGYALYQLAGHYLQVALPGLPTMPDRRSLIEYIVPRVTSFFKEPNYLAGYLVCLLPFTLAQFYREDAKKIVWSTVLAFQFAGLYLTFSTAGWLIFLAVTAYLLWGLRAVSIRTSVILGGVLAAVILALVIIQPQVFYEVIIDKLFGRFISPNTISRMERTAQVLNALVLFVHYPILGVGLGHYGLAADLAFNLNSSFNLTANNIYAELLAETGILGLVCFGWFLVVIGRRLWAQKRLVTDRTARIELTALWVSFVTLVLMLNFYPSHSLTFIWVWWGIYNGSTHILNRFTGVAAP